MAVVITKTPLMFSNGQKFQENVRSHVEEVSKKVMLNINELEKMYIIDESQLLISYKFIKTICDYIVLVIGLSFHKTHIVILIAIKLLEVVRQCVSVTQNVRVNAKLCKPAIADGTLYQGIARSNNNLLVAASDCV